MPNKIQISRWNFSVKRDLIYLYYLTVFSWSVELSQSFSFTNLSRNDKTVVQFWLRNLSLLLVCVCVCAYNYLALCEDCSASFYCKQGLYFVTKAISFTAVPGPAYGHKSLMCNQTTEFREYRLFFSPQISRALLVSCEFQDLWLKMMAIAFSLISSLWQYLIGVGLQIKHVVACAVANYLFHLLPSRIL